MVTLILLFTQTEIQMYLKISNYEKLLDAPHPSYTCINVEEGPAMYSIQIVEDETQQNFAVFLERKSNENNKFMFRIIAGKYGNASTKGWDVGEMEMDDIQNRTLFFKLLCHSIEEIKRNPF